MSKVINWTQYFMGVAKLSAFRSKDPNTQVGACIVNEANKIVGVGYNGLPWGCEDNEFHGKCVKVICMRPNILMSFMLN